MSSKVENPRDFLPPRDLTWSAVCFVQAWNVWGKCLEKSVSSAKITVSQFSAMQALFFNNRMMSPTEISRVLPLEKRSVSPLIDKLHKRKLVTRRRSKNDRRSIEVELSEQGYELMKGLIPSINKLLSDTFGSLSEKERDHFVRLIHKVIYSSADYLGADKKRLDETAVILSGIKEGVSKQRKKKGSASKGALAKQ